MNIIGIAAEKIKEGDAVVIGDDGRVHLAAHASRMKTFSNPLAEIFRNTNPAKVRTETFEIDQDGLVIKAKGYAVSNDGYIRTVIIEMIPR